MWHRLLGSSNALGADFFEFHWTVDGAETELFLWHVVRLMQFGFDSELADAKLLQGCLVDPLPVR